MHPGLSGRLNEITCTENIIMSWDYSSVAECLPSIRKALCLIPLQIKIKIKSMLIHMFVHACAHTERALKHSGQEEILLFSYFPTDPDTEER